MHEDVLCNEVGGNSGNELEMMFDSSQSFLLNVLSGLEEQISTKIIEFSIKSLETRQKSLPSTLCLLAAFMERQYV